MPEDGTEQCFHPECDRRATAVYEGTVPPADVIRRKACWIHGAKATPVRYLDTETDHDVVTDGGEDAPPEALAELAAERAEPPVWPDCGYWEDACECVSLFGDQEEGF
jgi:hypothetical protein